VVSNAWPIKKDGAINVDDNLLRLKLTNYIMANCPICLWIGVLWCWLRSLGCGQVSIAVLRLGSCSITATTIGCSRGRARALVRCLCVIIVAIMSSSLRLRLILLVLIWYGVGGRGCLCAVRIIGRHWLLVLLVLVLDSAHSGVRANCSLLI
jgi:hypothetical protein